jgi:hypothetical protein
MTYLSRYRCPLCGVDEDFHHWSSGDGVWHSYTCAEVRQHREELTDRVARVFHRYLQRHYPEYTWIRVREDDRLD